MSDDTTRWSTFDRLRRHRRIRLAAGLTAGAVLVTGGLFWLSGGWDSWQHDRALDSACGGTLAADPVRELVAGAEVEAEIRTGRDWWQCRVSEVDDEEHGRIDVRVTVSDRRSPIVSLDAEWKDAPLGHGWTGGFSFDPDAEDRGEASASVRLACADRTSAEPAAPVVAMVRARIDRADFGRPDVRSALTSVLTGTTTAYARQFSCRVTEGEPVREVGVSVNAWDYKPFASVSGSCAGIVDGRTAARWGVRTAVETAPGPKAVEGCTLGGMRGAPLYTFSASYGEALEWLERERLEDLAQEPPGDAPDGHYVLWADCPGREAGAAYTVAPHGNRQSEASDLALDHPGLRAALRSFAERSAKAHGCHIKSG